MMKFLSEVVARVRSSNDRILGIRSPVRIELRFGVAQDRHLDRCRSSPLLRGVAPRLWNFVSGDIEGTSLSIFHFSNDAGSHARHHTVALIEDPELASPSFSLQWVGWNTRPLRRERIDVPRVPGYSAYYNLAAPEPTARLAPAVAAFFSKRRELMAECTGGAVWLARYRACDRPEAEELLCDVYELANLLRTERAGRRLARVVFDIERPDPHTPARSAP